VSETTAYDLVVAAAERQELVTSRNGRGVSARCPAHEDKRASLSISRGDDGRALVYCFAGCPTPEVVSTLGLSMADLFGGERREYDAAQYLYTDEAGEPLIRVTRTWPKGFRQEAWDKDKDAWRHFLGDTRRVLYNLPEVEKAHTVWMVEGEKDVESIRQVGGAIATTLLGGAGNWKDAYGPSLRGKVVHIVADRDKPGKEGAGKVRNALRGIAKHADTWQPPEGYKDVSDMLQAGLGLGDLTPLSFADAEHFQPMEWEEWEAEEVQWLLEPYVPAGARVMAYGPHGSLKSLWAMWLASQLSKAGHKVAYFSLEMSPREVAKRMHKMSPPTESFKLFRRLNFESPGDLAAAQDLLRGYSLIVVDSWSAAHDRQNDNDLVSRIDREFFLPLIEETGATLLILDNTGQPLLTDRGKVQPDWARGASAKADKMDQTLHFERPDEGDNHLCRLRVKKVRGDGSIPKPALLKTDPDNIDFRRVDEHGADLGSLWGEAPPPPKVEPEDAPPSVLDRLREAREAARLKKQETQDE